LKIVGKEFEMGMYTVIMYQIASNCEQQIFSIPPTVVGVRTDAMDGENMCMHGSMLQKLAQCSSLKGRVDDANDKHSTIEDD